MTRFRIRFHSSATEDLERAAMWYVDQGPGLAEEFLTEFEAALERIAENPHIGTPHPAGDQTHPVRQRALRRFPYWLVFRVEEEHILTLIAVAHGHQSPDYWVKRLKADR